MPRVIIALAFALALVFHGAASAQDSSSTVTPLKVTLLQESAQFEVPYYDAFITAGEHKFTCVIPQGFLIKGNPSTGRLTLGTMEGDCSVSFTILNPAPADPGSISAEACRAFLLKKHPGGKILQESSAAVIGRSGPSIDVQWKTAENIYECERIAFVPTAYGTFLFTAASGRSAFPKTQANLGLIMTTFRIGADGKFNPVHIQTVN